MIFYLPIVYTIKTRYSSFFKRIVYFLTYILPEFLLLFFECYENFTIYRIIVIFALSMLSYINVYELGYIYNDTETIKKEKSPTLRLSEKQLMHYEKRKIFIYSVRFLQVFFLNFALVFFISQKSLVVFSLVELFTLTVYWIYNHVRGNTAMFFYFFLISARYVSVNLCSIENFTISVFLAALFVFPIIRTMEYKAHYGENSKVNLLFRKYIIKYDINKIPVFRLYATAVLLAISFALSFVRICTWIPLVMCSYMFIYRFSLWLAVKLGARFNGYLKKE